jgi:cytidine deaminase
LSSAALFAAGKSYAPYTKALSGVAVISTTGVMYQGSYIESAAYNPSLSPLQSALVGMIMAGEKPGNISAVTLVELENAPISQKSASRAILDGLAPAATLRRVMARSK